MDQNDDFHIEVGQSVRRHIEHKRSPVKDPELCALPYDQPDLDQTPVFIAEKVMRAIERHANEHKDKEVGGVLLGDFFRTDKGSFIEVTDYIEATATKGSDVSLTFTHETWEQINAEQTRRGSGLQIIGWYHSHPGLGVFMSREDEFIHSSFFADPWHVAIVVDPVYHNWGCFKWRDGSLERTAGFYVFGEKRAAKRVKGYTRDLDKSRQSTPPSASASADRGSRHVDQTPLWIAMGLILAWNLVVTCLLLTNRTPQIDYDKALRESDLGTAVSLLSSVLATNPDNKEAADTRNVLDKALSDPRLRNLDNAYLDRANRMLDRADSRALPPREGRWSEFWKNTLKDFDFSPERENLDQKWTEASRVYKESESTRGTRLERAENLKTIAEKAGVQSDNKDQDREVSLWYDQAYTRIKQERLRADVYAAPHGRDALDRISGGLRRKTFAELTDDEREAFWSDYEQLDMISRDKYGGGGTLIGLDKKKWRVVLQNYNAALDGISRDKCEKRAFAKLGLAERKEVLRVYQALADISEAKYHQTYAALTDDEQRGANRLYQKQDGELDTISNAVFKKTFIGLKSDQKKKVWGEYWKQFQADEQPKPMTKPNAAE